MLKLLDQPGDNIRLKHNRIRSEQAYMDWIKRHIVHFGKRHARVMGEKVIRTVFDASGRPSPYLRFYAESTRFALGDERREIDSETQFTRKLPVLELPIMNLCKLQLHEAGLDA